MRTDKRSERRRVIVARISGVSERAHLEWVHAMYGKRLHTSAPFDTSQRVDIERRRVRCLGHARNGHRRRQKVIQTKRGALNVREGYSQRRLLSH